MTAENPARDDGHYKFVTTCIDSTYEDMQALQSTERGISQRVFAKKIGRLQWGALQAALGYDRHFPIAKDWHVGYYRGVYREVPCVFLRHSKIEHIFTLDGRVGRSADARIENPPSYFSIEAAHLSRLEAVARRLYSERRMSGEEMRDAAHTIMAAVNSSRQMPED
ncbi:MAG: hypothetical protein IT371_30535 [Deltaproteobacteria bacterium]|nr:hypothetical protein [Deltaproteobacteria bacterium]